MSPLPETITVPAQHDQARLDTFLSHATGRSRSALQALIKAGAVTTSGKPLTKPSEKVTMGISLTLALPSPATLDIKPEAIALDILYEDADLIVINKAKGMVVHPAPGHHIGTLVNALMHHCQASLSGINGVMRPGIVHRIDKDTSGSLVVAKHDQAHQLLAQQFADHHITRRYHALVFGKLKQDRLTIDAPIGRGQKDRKKMAVTTPNSKRAVTHVTVLERFHYKASAYTLIEAQLETGRTHQIRVHLAHVGHPLVGDTVYGSEKQPFKTQGQVLHAKELGFVHPTTGERMHFVTERPDYFEQLLGVLQGVKKSCSTLIKSSEPRNSFL